MQHQAPRSCSTAQPWQVIIRIIISLKLNSTYTYVYELMCHYYPGSENPTAQGPTSGINLFFLNKKEFSGLESCCQNTKIVSTHLKRSYGLKLGFLKIGLSRFITKFLRTGRKMVSTFQFSLSCVTHAAQCRPLFACLILPRKEIWLRSQCSRLKTDSLCQ